MTMFDAGVSESLKISGMRAGAANSVVPLQLARAIAMELCRSRGSCTADDVGEVLFERHGIKTLGPAAGSLFRSCEFEHTGRFLKSSRVSNHARRLMEWRLKPEYCSML
jgi:hypothetical protein